MLKLLLYYHPLPRWGYDVQILLIVKLFLGRFAVISGGKADFLRRGELGGTAMNKQSTRQASIESFKKDPDYAAEYLKAVLEYGDQEELMIALRCIAVAFGMKAIAETAKLNSKSLYSALFSAGNPELRSFQAIFGAMGIHLSVIPLVHEMKSANDFGLVV